MKFFEKIKNFLAVSVARKVIAIVLCVVIVGGATTGIILGVSSCNGSSAGGDSTGDSTGPHDTYDNENDPLIFSTLEVDGVFNPFFYTSGTDGTILGMTQLSIFTPDEKGNLAYGDDEEVIAKDVKIVHNSSASGDTTTYYFVLKNNIKFSNGSPLTMKDVLFNYYVYLDPVYSGSSTMYSTDIVGLKEYRTQTTDENEQDNFMTRFQESASSRIDALVEAFEEIKDNLGGSFSSEKQLRTELENYSKNHTAEAYANIVADYDKAVQYFEAELQSDFNAAKGGWSDLEFYYKDSNNKKQKSSLKLTSDIEMFLYNEGLIEWVEKATTANPEGELKYHLGKETTQKLTQSGAVDAVRKSWLPNKADQVVKYWSATSSNLLTYITSDELAKYYNDSSKRQFKNISGIKFVNKDEAFTFTDDNGKTYTYEKPTYNDETTRDYVTSGNEVLSITINKVDPKAIWNFGIGVAPMYYYSDAEHIAKFDYEENFGVEYASAEFFENVLKNSDKNGVPVGAGAYAAASSGGGLLKTATDENVDLNQVSKDKGTFNGGIGLICYERNPYYDLAKNKNEDGSDWTKTAPDGKNYHVAKINRIRYSVLSANNMIDNLETGHADFVEPNANVDVMKTLDSKGIKYNAVETSGYGYIGINAGKVPGIHVRRAIMHSLDTNECVKYYKSMAKSIDRPMSTTNWAYPDETIPYYPYVGGTIPKTLLEKTGKNYTYAVYGEYRDYILELIAKGVLKESDVKAGTATLPKANQIEYLQGLVEEDGYKIGGSGIYSRDSGGKSDELKYTFTVAGDSNDHPAFSAMSNSKSLLDEVGFSITVKNDKDALLLLASGGLTVWAAAWSSTIDPDMYQVYHKDSKATSVLNWGYREILNDASDKYATEKNIVVELSKLIDQGREIENQNARKGIYATALDKIMELAVELPTYQRKDLFAYNRYKIDAKTFYQNPTSFKGLTSTLTSMSLIER